MSRAKVEATATPTAQHADPIFALIERHKQAEAAYDAAHERESRLEEELPANKRKTPQFFGTKTKIIKTDDPRWIEVQKIINACLPDELAMVLAETKPTTIAGVAALLAYAAEYIAKGKGTQWPDDWSYQLHKTLGEAVAGMEHHDYRTRDLEPQVCDVAKVGRMTTILIHDLMDGLMARKLIPQDDIEMYSFAADQLQDMTSDLKSSYYAALGSEPPRT